MDRPTVLIVGGFMTAPLNYWPLRRRLLRRGAEQVFIAPLSPLAWGVSSILGFGPVMTKTRAAIIRAYRAAGNEPVIVVAHSGGGIATRLAMSATKFYGRRAGVADAVGCLVTLGTPHRLGQLANRYRHMGHEAASFLDRESPGAFFAPRTAYLSVGSNYAGARFPGLIGRAFGEVFGVIVGEETAGVGDGIVPFNAIHLDGAEQLTFNDVRHGHVGANWYGSDEVIDRWWPRAVELWRGALEVRRLAAAGAGRAQPERSGESEQSAAAALTASSEIA